MKPKQIIEFINSFLEHQQSKQDADDVRKGKTPATSPLYYICELYQKALEEIQEDITKKAKGQKFVTISKRITKEIQKNTREELRCGWFENINGIDYQVFMNRNNSLAFFLTEQIDIPMTYEPEHTLGDRMPKTGDALQLPDYFHFLVDYKTRKAEAKKEARYKIGEKWFSGVNIEMVIQLIGEIEEHKQTRKNYPDIITGKNGFVLIMPLRVTE